MNRYGKRKDMTPFIELVRESVKDHQISEGKYACFTKGKNAMQEDEYGCADAANILYTIGEFPKDFKERACWIENLQKLQDPETGYFFNETHFPMHTTAHCLAALELFDIGPRYSLTALEPYKTREGLYELLESLRWKDSPWDNSHIGAGIYAAWNLAGHATPEWNEWYFEWMKNECDPYTGLWRKGCADIDHPKIYAHMAGTFHYLFNHEHAKRPHPYPERLIDTCLNMYDRFCFRKGFGEDVGFLEVDWVYCITRALRQSGYRYEDCVKAIRHFAENYLEILNQARERELSKLDNLHQLFGALCCVAELQQFLPGYVYTEKPLKLVLDRRPFI